MTWYERKLLVKEFCEREFPKYYEKYTLDEFCPEREIASLRLLSLDVSVGFDCVEIKRPHKDMPQAIVENFERHLWYSKFSLSDIRLITIPIDHEPMSVFIITGFIDDAWDNSGCWLEIFNQQGAFLDTASVGYKSWRWLGKPIRGNSFPTPAPEWTKNKSKTPNALPVWSEAVLGQNAVILGRSAVCTQESDVTGYALAQDH